MERTKMPNLQNGTKEEFEPGLTWPMLEVDFYVSVKADSNI